MATNTTAVAKQVRLQQWAQQITDCQNRPVGMKVIDWCDANGIILSKRGKALPRHGRRVKAGCVKHRKPLSIILTASWPRSMSVFCNKCCC